MEDFIVTINSLYLAKVQPDNWKLIITVDKDKKSIEDITVSQIQL